MLSTSCEQVQMIAAFVAPIFCTARSGSNHPPRKPRIPPNFSQSRKQVQKWQPSEDPAITAVSIALEQWRIITNHPPGQLPSDSHLRRCDTARELRLRSLILRAGGHKVVQARLGLKRSASSQNQEVEALADAVRRLYEREGRKISGLNFPTMNEIRRLNPKLGNRIAALPGHNGLRKVREKFLVTNMTTNSAVARKWRSWADPEGIRAELLAFQRHPQVLPRLCSLPADLELLIQRQGGASAFVREHRMILEKDWVNVARFANLVNWMVDQLDEPRPERGNVPEYLEMVKRQCISPPSFPLMSAIVRSDMLGEMKRYGGRRGLACRLGFERSDGPRGVFMGEFSLTFAADVLSHAVEQVYVTTDSYLGMPTIANLKAHGRHDLARATEFLGGEEDVGRRLGLVPMCTQETE